MDRQALGVGRAAGAGHLERDREIAGGGVNVSGTLNGAVGRAIAGIAAHVLAMRPDVAGGFFRTSHAVLL